MSGDRLDLRQVRRAFARAAATYERHDALQREVESRLIDSLDYYEGKPQRVLDIGCGTGDALNYLSGYTRYVGADTDAVAIEAAKQRHGARPNTEFRCGLLTPEEVQELRPTVVVLAGLLHHLSDETANNVLRLSAAPSVRRIVTQDIVYLSGVEHWVSNAFAALDRGRFCRRPEGYRELVRRAGVTLVSDDLIWADQKSRRARYFVMTLVS